MVIGITSRTCASHFRRYSSAAMRTSFPGGIPVDIVAYGFDYREAIVGEPGSS
jgi:hypothetical protein